MASKRPSTIQLQMVDLTEAVTKLNSNFEKLSDRLFGDPDRQLKGLTHEVQELGATSERGLREAADAIAKLNAGMTAVEAFKRDQEERNARFQAVADDYNEKKSQALGGWKLITLVAGIVSTCWGGIWWMITHIK